MWKLWPHHYIKTKLPSHPRILSFRLSLKMERATRVFPVILVLLLLIMTTEMGPSMVEARTCESQSHRFKGPCVRGSNCAAVCQTEGFSGGICRGLRRRCFCTKHC
ncbi:defensin-like protein [Magnolia sinica]|uniref:defensin-like protein n=1 Tax=Magnolia sinica TaxID=86752 RepID=UPI00265964B4|nr:defensin-like protein [Magnolia sinica]